MSNPNKEYLFFEQLTRDGVNKTRRKLFSYTSNGAIKEELCVEGCPDGREECFIKIKKDAFSSNSFRKESYWVLPTYLDRRLLDLDFREREPEEAKEGPLNRNELVEIYFLRRIVEEARKTIK